MTSAWVRVTLPKTSPSTPRNVATARPADRCFHRFPCRAFALSVCRSLCPRTPGRGSWEARRNKTRNNAARSRKLFMLSMSFPSCDGCTIALLLAGTSEEKNVHGDLLVVPDGPQALSVPAARVHLDQLRSVLASGVMCGNEQYPRPHTCLCQLTICNFHTRFKPMERAEK